MNIQPKFIELKVEEKSPFPLCMTKEELIEDLPKLLKTLEEDATPFKNESLIGMGSYQKGNKRYYFDENQLISPYRDGKYGLGYLSEFQVEILKEKK